MHTVETHTFIAHPVLNEGVVARQLAKIALRFCICVCLFCHLLEGGSRNQC